MAGATTSDNRHITGKGALRYMLLPGFLPRLRDLGGSGFGYLAFLIARVYNAVRILPNAHPYNNPANIGQFNVRQVIAAAAGHIKADRKHIDQIIIFLAVIAGIVILALQFVLMAIALISSQAFAQETGSFDGIFTTTRPTDDIAFMMLDHVFGIPDFFNSKVMAGGQTPLHIALQALFRFYNMAILIVAVLIFLYFIFVVVAETAQTGSPFGQRFNSVYAPLRLVFAIGLLVPLNYGFNASQYITLQAAKMGSGMATNGWTIYNNTLRDAGETPLGKESKYFIADIKPPEADNLAAFATILHTCIESYKVVYGEGLEIKGYIISDGKAHEFAGGGAQEHANEFSSTSSGMDFKTARDITKNGDVHVVFGELDKQFHSDQPGGVMPYCGAIVIPMSARNPDVFGDRGSGGSRGGPSIGPELVQNIYFIYAQNLLGQAGTSSTLGGAGEKLKALGKRFSEFRINYNACSEADSLGLGTGATGCVTNTPDATVQNMIKKDVNPIIKAGVERAINISRNGLDLTITDEILSRGWGGAGMWYNKIADIGGSMAATIKAFPTQTKYPLVMEKVQTSRDQKSKQAKACEVFDPDQAGGKKIDWDDPEELKIAQALADAHKYWCQDKNTGEVGLTSNAIWDAIHLVFGTNGLFDLRQNRNSEVHPLAQMTATGRLLVESSVRNIMAAIGSSAIGGLAGGLDPHIGSAFMAMSSFFVSIATIGLIAGFILFYILPFLPFIYFFFAVGKWVKTIFEAMVGAPLWALAHLRIDGDGFPGRSASNGYFLIFEIFIRPILTVFGLIGGLAIFTALVIILNELFNIVVFNLAGTDLDAGTGSGGTIDIGFESMRRNIVDQFFYTIVYAVVMYMMAVSSFKMIDLVPNSILRWMGAGVSSFSDNTQDATEGLVQYAAIGGYTVGNQLVGATQKFGNATGQVFGALAKTAISGGKPPPGGNG